MFFVTLGVACFTLFCWSAAADLGMFLAFPVAEGFLSQRATWLLLAALAWLFAKLIDSFAKLLKSPTPQADELATEPVPQFAAASE
jgi:hypothetical protein